MERWQLYLGIYRRRLHHFDHLEHNHADDDDMAADDDAPALDAGLQSFRSRRYKHNDDHDQLDDQLDDDHDQLDDGDQLDAASGLHVYSALVLRHQRRRLYGHDVRLPVVDLDHGQSVHHDDYELDYDRDRHDDR